MLADIVDNKKIILVARSPRLLDNPECKNQADFIDSHDVVVRINSPPPPVSTTQNIQLAWNDLDHFVAEPFQKYLGKKTHIMMLSRTKHSSMIKFLPCFVKDGGIVVGSAQWRSMFCTDTTLQKSINKIKEYIPYVPLPQSIMEYSNIHWNEKYFLPTEPTTGIVSLFHLLHYNIKSIQLIGYTMWQTRYVSDMQRRQYKDYGMQYIKWLEHMMENDNRIIITPHLKKIMKDVLS